MTSLKSVRRESGGLIITLRPEGIYFREKGRRYGVRETVTRTVTKDGETRIVEKTVALGFCLPTARAYQVAARLHADQVIAERRAARKGGRGR